MRKLPGYVSYGTVATLRALKLWSTADLQRARVQLLAQLERPGHKRLVHNMVADIDQALQAK